MSTRRAALIALGLGAWLASACGLATSGTDGTEGTETPSVTSTSNASSSSGTGGVITTATGAGGDPTTTSASSQSAGGGGVGGSATSTSSSTTTTATTGGGGAPPCTAPGGVCCGDQFCDLATSKCCAQQANMSGSCIPKGVACSPTETVMECDDQADCPMAECCAKWSGSMWTSVTCNFPCVPPPAGGPEEGDYPQCIVGTSCSPPLQCLPDLSNFGPPHGYCDPP